MTKIQKCSYEVIIISKQESRHAVFQSDCIEGSESAHALL